MNASPINSNPVSPAQTQAAAGKQQDAATSDAPFSKVLSSEIAQNKHGSDAGNKTGAPSGPKADKKAGDPKKAVDPKDASAGAFPSAGTLDPQNPLAGQAIAGPAVAGQTAADPVQTDPPPATPDTFLGLAIQPDAIKLAPAGKGEALPQQAAATKGKFPTPLDAHKGRSQAAPQTDLQADLQTDKTATAQKTDAAAQAKASAADFAGQLIAARQSETTKTRDPLADLMANSTLRTAPQAPLDAPLPLNDVAAGKLAPSVGSTAWGQALGDKVVWMAAGGQQTATLTLTPPNLGPLHIELKISNDQATASFFSTHPDVRHALEAAFPRLREMMNDAGIQLGQATVSADTPQQNYTPDRQAQQPAPPFSGMNESVSAGLPAVHAPARQSGLGLIDTFA
jgi:flagellar hook-length control protein FliK